MSTLILRKGTPILLAVGLVLGLAISLFMSGRFEAASGHEDKANETPVLACEDLAKIANDPDQPTIMSIERVYNHEAATIRFFGAGADYLIPTDHDACHDSAREIGLIIDDAIQSHVEDVTSECRSWDEFLKNGTAVVEDDKILLGDREYAREAVEAWRSESCR